MINKQDKSMFSGPSSGGHFIFDDGAKIKLLQLPQCNRQPETHSQHASESGGLPLPRRSTGAVDPVANSLLDDDNEGASAIPSLHPMRHQSDDLG